MENEALLREMRQASELAKHPRSIYSPGLYAERKCHSPYIRNPETERIAALAGVLMMRIQDTEL